MCCIFHMQRLSEHLTDPAAPAATLTLPSHAVNAFSGHKRHVNSLQQQVRGTILHQLITLWGKEDHSESLKVLFGLQGFANKAGRAEPLESCRIPHRGTLSVSGEQTCIVSLVTFDALGKMMNVDRTFKQTWDVLELCILLTTACLAGGETDVPTAQPSKIPRGWIKDCETLVGRLHVWRCGSPVAVGYSFGI